jgi:hypothetical protein
MQDQSEPRSARAAIFLITALIALLVPASPALAQTTAGPDAAAGLSPRLLADSSWHGRPIQRPWRLRSIALRAKTSGAASLRPGSGFSSAGGSDRVRRLQRGLTTLGYRPGKIDGLFGPRTQATLIAFQRKHGLPETGVAGPVTLRTLRGRTSDRPPSVEESSSSTSRPASAPVAAASEPEASAARSDSRPQVTRPGRADSGLDTTTLIFGLGIAVAVLILIGLLAPRRPERRASPAAPGLGALNGSAARAIGYAAGRETLLRRQEQEIVTECDSRRLELVELVTDAVGSGVAAHDRPGLRRMLNRIRDGDASTVVVSRLDRLGASHEEIRGVLWTVARNQASVIVLSDAEANGTERDRTGRAAGESKLMEGRGD